MHGRWTRVSVDHRNPLVPGRGDDHLSSNFVGRPAAAATLSLSLFLSPFADGRLDKIEAYQ